MTTALACRPPATQITEPGTLAVTVGRYGQKTWAFGGIYTTKIYTAHRRADGVLVWRLWKTIGSHGTAGKGITKPMVERARRYAESEGLRFEAGITQNKVCG